MRDRGHHIFCQSFLLMGRLLPFLLCSSVSLSHGVQSFRNSLLHWWVPCGVISPARKTAAVWAALCCQDPAPAQASMGSQPPLGLHLLCRGLLQGLQGISAPHGPAGAQLPLHGLHQGNLSSSACSSSCPSAPDPAVCRAVSLTYSQSPLQLQFLLHWFLPPFHKGTATTEVLSVSLLGSALASGCHWLHRENFQQLLAKATSAAPLVPKVCHINPVQSLN